MSADCLSFAAGCSDAALAVVADRVISLDWPDREAVRQAKFRTQFWPDDLMQFVDAKAASSEAGIDLSLGGVVHQWGRVIDQLPAPIDAQRRQARDQYQLLTMPLWHQQIA